mmetsp:Transcript_15301/g.14880  ORF Transcript_15301/g.14880 Transcript_15301/m.14880 type:complete len:107 (+) Transcript_15301:235-555(+)
MFTHKKKKHVEGHYQTISENYFSLKEALLELYLSVKIRSDEEIDNYTEEQFKKEKDALKEVDGFTLIDYIKSSVEILMNMKIEENEGSSVQNEKLKKKKKKMKDKQ